MAGIRRRVKLPEGSQCDDCDVRRARGTLTTLIVASRTCTLFMPGSWPPAEIAHSYLYGNLCGGLASRMFSPSNGPSAAVPCGKLSLAASGNFSIEFLVRGGSASALLFSPRSGGIASLRAFYFCPFVPVTRSPRKNRTSKQSRSRDCRGEARPNWADWSPRAFPTAISALAICENLNHIQGAEKIPGL